MEGKYKDVNLVSGSAGERLRVRHSEGSVCASGGKATPNVRPQLAYSEDNSVDQLWKRAKKKRVGEEVKNPRKLREAEHRTCVQWEFRRGLAASE